MIEELANIISLQKKKGKVNAPKDALPGARCEGRNHESLQKYIVYTNTYACREPKKGSWARTTSILKRHRLGQTTARSLYAAMYRQRCDFSTDQVGKASSEYLFVARHL